MNDTLTNDTLVSDIISNVPSLNNTILNTTTISNETLHKIYPDGTVWDSSLIQRTVTLSLFIFFTILGNSIIVFVLTRPQIRKLSTRVNLFILNLAIGDITVACVTMVTKLLSEIFGKWIFGAVACKVIVYFQLAMLASTIFILLGMTYDRYQAICKPLTPKGSLNEARKLIIGAWVLAFVIAIPQLFIFVQVQDGVTVSGLNRYMCSSKGYSDEWQRKLYLAWSTMYLLLVPSILIIYFYYNLLQTVWKAGQSKIRRSENASISRAKMKTLRLTVCIITSYIICWTPYITVTNIIVFGDNKIKIPRNLLVLVENLSLMNSVLNPLFYGYFNDKLRSLFYENFLKKFNIKCACWAEDGLTFSTWMSRSLSTQISVITPSSQPPTPTSIKSHPGFNNQSTNPSPT